MGEVNDTNLDFLDQQSTVPEAAGIADKKISIAKIAQDLVLAASSCYADQADRALSFTSRDVALGCCHAILVDSTHTNKEVIPSATSFATSISRSQAGAQISNLAATAA
mmetsp:Transcript_18254/g.43662  ORF Transcript_18254/g.43662 Transcript_18254/m.43662 type:complete len:109 (+) Transcript_18254:132-458(+)